MKNKYVVMKLAKQRRALAKEQLSEGLFKGFRRNIGIAKRQLKLLDKRERTP